MYREIDPYPYNFEAREQVKLHLKGELDEISIPNVRGVKRPPYLCPKLTDKNKKTSVIFMSFGYKKRSNILLKSLANQKGINSEQLEIIACTNQLLDISKIPFEVKTFPLEKEIHKTFILNSASAYAKGNVLVFIDADALLPPFFIAHVLHITALDKLYVSIRKNLDYELSEILIRNDTDLSSLDYYGLRDILPYYWSFNFLSYTPSGFMHVLSKNLFYEIGKYDESFKDFSDYDWEFASRIADKCGQPILVPDMWAIHLDHPKDYSGEQIKKMKIEL